MMHEEISTQADDRKFSATTRCNAIRDSGKYETVSLVSRLLSGFPSSWAREAVMTAVSRLGKCRRLHKMSEDHAI